MIIPFQKIIFSICLSTGLDPDFSSPCNQHKQLLTATCVSSFHVSINRKGNISIMCMRRRRSDLHNNKCYICLSPTIIICNWFVFLIPNSLLATPLFSVFLRASLNVRVLKDELDKQPTHASGTPESKPYCHLSLVSVSSTEWWNDRIMWWI